MKFTSSIVALACATGLATAQTTLAPETNCTIFNWNQAPVYLVNDTQRQRVSGASTCAPKSNSSHACPIEVHGDLDASFRANISANILRDHYYNTGSGSSSFYFDLVNRTVPSANTTSTGIPFRNYVVGNINTIESLPPGTSGYLEFQRIFQCVAGTLSNCTANTLPDNTPVEFCAPLYHTTDLRTNTGVTILDGEFFLNQIDASNVSQYPDPFAGLSRGTSSASKVVSTSLMALVGAVMATLMMS